MADRTRVNRETQGKTRRYIHRELPPIGTVLQANYRGQGFTAEVVRSGTDPKKRAIRLGQQEYRSMSGAAIAITGHAVNGWRFWHAD